MLVEDPELVAVTVVVVVVVEDEVAAPAPVVVPVPDPPAPSVNSSSPRIAAHPESAVPASASPIHFAVTFIAAAYQTWVGFGSDERRLRSVLRFAQIRECRRLRRQIPPSRFHVPSRQAANAGQPCHPPPSHVGGPDKRRRSTSPRGARRRASNACYLAGESRSQTMKAACCRWQAPIVMRNATRRDRKVAISSARPAWRRRRVPIPGQEPSPAPPQGEVFGDRRQ